MPHTKKYNLIIPRFFCQNLLTALAFRYVLSNANHWLGLCREIHMLEAKLQSPRTCRGQMPEDEDEAEDNLSRPRPRTKFRPRGQSSQGLNITGIYRQCQSPVFVRTRHNWHGSPTSPPLRPFTSDICWLFTSQAYRFFSCNYHSHQAWRSPIFHNLH